MVDVGHKPITAREALAEGFIRLQRSTILAIDSVPAARETASTPAMADRPVATTAHITFSVTRPLAGARETIGFRCDPPEPGLVDRPGETALAAVIVTSCTGKPVSCVGLIRKEAAHSPLIQQPTLMP